MSPSDELADLFTTLTGAPPGARTRAAFADLCVLAGREDEAFPPYLRAMVQALRARQPHRPRLVPERDRGYSWLLRELQPALPDSEFIAAGHREYLVLHRIALAGVVDVRDPETYAVVPWPEPSEPSEASVPTARVLGTFDPTDEQIRHWAYAPDLRLTDQDEHAALSQPRLLPLLITLAADPRCPKRDYLIAIVDEYVSAAQRGRYDRRLLEQVRAQAAAAGPADLRAWAIDLAYLLDYLDGQGPVCLAAAREIARLTMSGRYRPGIALHEGQVGDWWAFTAAFTADGWEIDHLYINPATGALRWSGKRQSADELAAYTHPVSRDDALRGETPDRGPAQ